MTFDSRTPVLLAFSVLLAATCPAARGQCPAWDSGFHAAGAFDEVRALTAFDDGQGEQLYVGGKLLQVGAQSASGLARSDGSVWELIGDVKLDSLPGEVDAIAVFDDGSGPKLFIGGRFDTVGGEPANNVARWDGTTWVRLGQGTSGEVRALHVFDDGSGPALYIGGSFAQANGIVVNGVARWRLGVWSALGQGVTVGSGASGSVFGLEVFDPGTGPELFATGGFVYAGGSAADAIASWNGTGWSAVAGGLIPQSGRALKTFDDGSGPALYVVGSFFSAGGQAAKSIARWNGSNWSALGSGLTLNASASSFGSALGVHDAGTGPALYVGGRFDKAGGVSAPNIASWNGTSFTAVGSGLNAPALCFESFDEGSGAKLFVGGGFSSPTGQGFVTGLGRWDGAAWSAVGDGNGIAGIGVQVDALELFDSGAGPELYATGTFQGAGMQSASGVARWNGTGWSPLGSGLAGNTASPASSGHALRVFDAGSGPELYVGGTFTSAGGVPSLRLARWNGTSWAGVPDGPGGSVFALEVFDDGSGPALYVGGYFPSGIGGTIGSYGIGRWNGSSWSSVAGGLGNSGWWVKSLEVFNDGNGPALYAAGFFYSAGGTSVNHVARWDGTSWSALGGGLGFHQGYALVVHDDGLGSALYVSGDFDEVGGVPMDHVARWDGTSWSALASDPFGTPTVEILGLASLDLGLGTGTQLLALGSCVGGTGTSPAIAAWNSTAWSPVGPALGGSVDPFVRAAALFDDGSSSGASLFVGGRFATAGGELSASVARLRTCDLPGVAFCAGDGSAGACPCANTGLPGHGCENSSGSGGAVLEASGGALLAQDGLVLRASGELPSALSIFLQGGVEIAPVTFGDGLRCVGGTLKRLYVENAIGGVASAPLAGDAAVHVRSAQLGDPIGSGEARVYQTYYRDPDASFCSAPSGNSWNVTNALRIVWH